MLLAGCVVGEKADGLLEQRVSDRTLLVYRRKIVSVNRGVGQVSGASIDLSG